METINIVLAEDNPVYLDGLCYNLADMDGVSVCGTARDGAALLEVVAAKQPQLVITDIHMPVMNGIEATRLLSSRYPELRVIALTMYPDDRYIVDMLEAGARGYLNKNCTADELAAAIHEVHNGYFYYCRTTTISLSKMIAASRKIPLGGFRDAEWSEGELQIIQLVCADYRSKEIAYRMGLATDTVKKYRSAIMKKAGVSNKAGLIVYAVKKGLYQEEGS